MEKAPTLKQDLSDETLDRMNSDAYTQHREAEDQVDTRGQQVEEAVLAFKEFDATTDDADNIDEFFRYVDATSAARVDLKGAVAHADGVLDAGAAIYKEHGDQLQEIAKKEMDADAEVDKMNSDAYGEHKEAESQVEASTQDLADARQALDEFYATTDKPVGGPDLEKYKSGRAGAIDAAYAAKNDLKGAVVHADEVRDAGAAIYEEHGDKLQKIAKKEMDADLSKPTEVDSYEMRS